MNFDGYICAVTGLPCCGCSMFCANRVRDTEDDNDDDNRGNDKTT